MEVIRYNQNIMAVMWDTFGLFQALLDDFEKLLSSARNLRTTEPEDSLAVKAAVVGFGQFSPLSEWGQQHYQIIAKRLQDELSLEELSWYEECAEAVSVFACLALGALLGKFQAGEIDDAGFMLGDAHLPAFLSLHNEAICARYSA